MNDKQQAIERGKRLRLIRKIAGLTRNQLAESIGMTPTTLSTWENANFNGITLGGGEKVITTLLSKGVHCSLAWLMEGIGQPPEILSELLGNDSISLKPEPENNIHKEMIFFLRLNPKSITFQIRDPRLMPFLKPGDWVGGLWQAPNATIINEFSIIKVNQEEEVCLIQAGSQPDHYTLCYTTQLNLETLPLQRFDVKLKEVAVITRLWRN